MPSSIISLFVHAKKNGLPIAASMQRRLHHADVLEAAAGRIATQTPRDIEQFLGFLASHAPEELPRLEAALARGTRLGAIREVLLHSPFAEVLRLLMNAPRTSRLALAGISLEAWRARPWARDRGLASSLAVASNALKIIDRRDLLNEVARQSVLQRDTSDWRPARKGARRLLAVLRSFPIDASDTLESFMSEVSESGDLDRMFNNMNMEAAMELVYGLSTRLGPRAAAFVTPTFRRKLEGCFSPKAIERPAGFRTMIRAAGLCSILSIARPPATCTSPSEQLPSGDENDVLFTTGLGVLTGLG